MNVNNQKLALSLFFLCFLSLHIYVKEETRPSSESKSVPVGEKIQNFQGSTLSGEVFDLEQVTSSHQLTVLNFWEAWCGPCKKEIPDLQRIHSQFGGEKLKVVGVHTSSNHAAVDKIINKFGVTYAMVHDSDESIAKRFKVKAVPTTVVLDSEMKVLRSREGLDIGLRGFLMKNLKR